MVEDTPADAELTLRALQKSLLANDIQLARDSAEALDFLFCRGAFSSRHSDAAPRVVLPDLRLPKVDGLHAHDLERGGDMVNSYRYGVNSYIQKPVSFREFQGVVRQLGMYWLLVNAKPPAAAFSAAASVNE